LHLVVEFDELGCLLFGFCLVLLLQVIVIHLSITVVTNPLSFRQVPRHRPLIPTAWFTNGTRTPLTVPHWVFSHFQSELDLTDITVLDILLPPALDRI